MLMVGRMAVLAVMTAVGALAYTAAVPVRLVSVRSKGTDSDVGGPGRAALLEAETKGEIDRELWRAEFGDAFATAEAKRAHVSEIEARFIAMGHDPDAVREHVSYALMEIAAEKSW